MNGAPNCRTLAIVQARLGSTRFPNKVLRPVMGVPLIELLLERLALAKRVDQIILATPDTASNKPLAEYVRKLGYEVYQGSENDVLDRYYRAASLYKPSTVIRITGDCPLVDAEIVDAVVAEFESAGADYVSNTLVPTFSDGLDVEVFSYPALERAWREAQTSYDREHVTPYLKASDKFRVGNVAHSEDCSALRWTVDEPEDLDVVRRVFEHYAPRRDFGWLEVLELSRSHPQWFEANRHLFRDEGAQLGTGQKLWRRAKKIIPGGSMLLSKRAEMFLPGKWPAYFSKATGCKVWDLDGREFIDMSLMGVGTNTLGYGHPEVDDAVRAVVDTGNMSTLNCPEEVYLAERLVALHPWADMVRFARSGGEANAVAIRIARAAAGKDKVAICGYHGWHDWYLAANLGDDSNLAGHLLPGLQPNGVPGQLRGSIYTFNYNRMDELEELLARQDIGVIMMEVSRNQEPEDGFLSKVRRLASDHGIVLVFDECTSGFRQTLGGLHKLYDVAPDMAIFGKALGNGYAITATIGRREIMDAAQSSFISSTFWTERIGPAAGLKTLEIMERIRSYEQITQMGRRIDDGWRALAKKHGLDITISGLPSMLGFSFARVDMLACKTLITQEMLAKGYLATNSVYVCTEHKPEVVAAYLENLDPVFGLIRECEEGRDIATLLKGPVCQSGFKRIN